MTQSEALALMVHAAWSALNCEGIAKDGAEHFYETAVKRNGSPMGITKQDCTEFDNIRAALNTLNSHGFDVEALFQQADNA